MGSQASTSKGLAGGTAATRHPRNYGLFNGLGHAVAGGSTRDHGLRPDATAAGAASGLDGLLAGLEGIP